MAIQIPQNWWQLTLTTFAWAWRIPLAAFIVFTCGCVGVLGFMFIFRATAWIFKTLLAHPW
jgi:hypothetical protein